MGTNILEIHSLSKRYKKVQALSGLDMTVEKGMVFGILGPNGSGKTTTLGILLGVIKPTTGRFSWFGNGTVDANRKRIGALLETPNFYPYLNAIRNLRIVGKIKQIENLDERIEIVLKAVDLWERKDSKFKTFSLGMKQRLAIASALLNDPEVLVLDEPTNGLDPQGIAEIRKLIKDIAARGKTILIASHQLDEIEKVCTDVVILKNGIALHQNKIDHIIGKSRQVVISCADLEKLEMAIAGLEGASLEAQKEWSFVLNVSEDMTTTKINQYFFDQGIVLSELREVRKSLEDQFLEMTKA